MLIYLKIFISMSIFFFSSCQVAHKMVTDATDTAETIKSGFEKIEKDIQEPVDTTVRQFKNEPQKNIKVDSQKELVKHKTVIQNAKKETKIDKSETVKTLRGLKTNIIENNINNSKKFYALVISIKDYKYLTPLKTPNKDGKAIGDILKNNYNFDVSYLNNPTRSEITKKLNEYKVKLKLEDNFLIYYAGHGIQVNNDGYWLPSDAKNNDDTEWISNDYLSRKIKNIKASNILILADSCYSGTLTRSISIIEDNNKPLSVYLDTKSRMVITSGGLSPVLDGGGGGHSIFARFLINYLSTSRKSFTATDLYTAINKNITEMSMQLGVRQIPMLAAMPRSGHVGPDFVFLKK